MQLTQSHTLTATTWTRDIQWRKAAPLKYHMRSPVPTRCGGGGCITELGDPSKTMHSDAMGVGFVAWQFGSNSCLIPRMIIPMDFNCGAR